MIVEAIEKNSVTTIHFVPSMLGAFLEQMEEKKAIDQLGSLKQVFSSGEPLTPKHVNLFNKLLKRKAVRLINLYGPTEAAIDVTYYNCEKDNETEIVPIGKPIDNIRLYILDQSGNLLPKSVSGELCIAGDGLARGYLNSPVITAEKFVDNPYEKGEKMYRTGDLARWMPDGNIEYLGRIDQQVKIRGFRIELGDIESQMLKHEDIWEAVVLTREDSEGNKFLTAYYVSDMDIPNKELRDFLSLKLPVYMVPSYFIHLEKLPLNRNGKIDRKMLPDPLTLYIYNEKIKLPETELHKIINQVFEESLNFKPISIDQSVIELGLNSLHNIKIVNKLQKHGFKISFSDIFNHPSTVELSNFIESNKIIEKNNPYSNDLISLIHENCHFTSKELRLKLENNNKKIHLLFADEPLIDSIIETLKDKISNNNFPNYILPLSYYPEALTDNQEISYTILKDIIGCKNVDSIATYNVIRQEIELHKKEFNGYFKKNDIVLEYPVTPCQKQLFDSLTMCSVFSFDYFVDVKILEQTLLIIISEQLVFRSMLNKEGNQWAVFSPPASIKIPVIDISMYDSNRQSFFIYNIIEDVFKRMYESNELLYQFILIKKNLKDYCLFLSISHLIFDVLSENVLRGYIVKYYNAYLNHKEIINEKINTYDEYVFSIQNDNRLSDFNELNKLFNLYEIYQYQVKIKQFIKNNIVLPNQDKAFKVEYNLKYKNSMEEDVLWKHSLIFYMLFLSQYFQIDKIPVEIVNFGRYYQNKYYFKTIGLFLDFIPFLIPINREDPMKMAEDAFAKINYLFKEGLVFINNAYARLNADKIQQQHTKQPALMAFNYLGNYRIYSIEESILDDERRKESAIDAQKLLFYVDIRTTDKNINFSIYSMCENSNNKILEIFEELKKEMCDKIRDIV